MNDYAAVLLVLYRRVEGSRAAAWWSGVVVSGGLSELRSEGYVVVIEDGQVEGGDMLSTEGTARAKTWHRGKTFQRSCRLSPSRSR